MICRIFYGYLLENRFVCKEKMKCRNKRKIFWFSTVEARH